MGFWTAGVGDGDAAEASAEGRRGTSRRVSGGSVTVVLVGAVASFSAAAGVPPELRAAVGSMCR